MKTSRYNIGQVVKHKTHGYSAVIIDVDSLFQPSGHMNPHTAQKEFTKPGPWYRLLVNDTELVTYADESDLELISCDLMISHPQLQDFLVQETAGQYHRKGISH